MESGVGADKGGGEGLGELWNGVTRNDSMRIKELTWYGSQHRTRVFY